MSAQRYTIVRAQAPTQFMEIRSYGLRNYFRHPFLCGMLQATRRQPSLRELRSRSGIHLLGLKPHSGHENPLKWIRNRLPADFSGLRRGIDPPSESEKLAN
jgi:hypothetical protein